MGDAYRIYDHLTPPVTHISLCSGYGGIDIGLKRAIPDLLTIAYAEIEAFACANLVAKMEEGHLDAAPIFSDLKTFPWEDFRGVVDIVSGGFPCQPFSQAGKRNADTDERHLFPFILDGIRKCRPSFVFLENVEGIISAKLSGDGWRDPEGTPVLLYVLRELERVGYKATAGIFSASEVGAPHQRKRVFILAYDDSNGGRQGRLLRQRADGKITISDGEAGRVELANSENKRCRGRSDRDRNDARGISEQKTQFKSVFRSETERCCGDSREAMADSCNCADSEKRLCQKGSLQAEHRQKVCARVVRGADAKSWPSRPGQPQYEWEPPRTVEIESKMDRIPNGPPSGMGYAELCVSSDSRNDELRLLGNGVVPQTCTKAFVTLLQRLIDD